jgi:hypothetical protein
MIKTELKKTKINTYKINTTRLFELTVLKALDL